MAGEPPEANSQGLIVPRQLFFSQIKRLPVVPLRGRRDALFINLHAPWYFTLTFTRAGHEVQS